MRGKVAYILRSRHVNVIEIDANANCAPTHPTYDLTVAIHYQSWNGKPDNSGFGVFVPDASVDRDNARSIALAKVISATYAARTGLTNYSSPRLGFGPVSWENANTSFYYLWNTQNGPLALIECGVGAPGAPDHDLLYASIDSVAADLAEGICKALGVEWDIAPPPPVVVPPPAVPEWKKNAVPTPLTTQIDDSEGVTVCNMETGAPVTVVRSQLVTAYTTSVKGFVYVMTQYSYDHDIPNGVRIDELKAATVPVPLTYDPHPEAHGDGRTFPLDPPSPVSQQGEIRLTADTTRADVDALGLKIVDLMAAGDGVEPGLKTTEFWLTVLAVAADVAGPAVGLSLSPDERMYGAAALVVIYGGYRSWRKANGPAKLWAEVLNHIAELRSV